MRQFGEFLENDYTPRCRAGNDNPDLLVPFQSDEDSDIPTSSDEIPMPLAQANDVQHDDNDVMVEDDLGFGDVDNQNNNTTSCNLAVPEDNICWLWFVDEDNPTGFIRRPYHVRVELNKHIFTPIPNQGGQPEELPYIPPSSEDEVRPDGSIVLELGSWAFEGGTDSSSAEESDDEINGLQQEFDCKINSGYQENDGSTQKENDGETDGGF